MSAPMDYREIDDEDGLVPERDFDLSDLVDPTHSEHDPDPMAEDFDADFDVDEDQEIEEAMEDEIAAEDEGEDAPFDRSEEDMREDADGD